MNEHQDLRTISGDWAGCFTTDYVEGLTDQIAKGLLSRMLMPYDSDADLINSLGSLLVGRPLNRWEDSTVVSFGREAHDVIRRVEEYAIASGAEIGQNSRASDGVAKLLTLRMTELFERLVVLVGPDEAAERLQHISILEDVRSS